MPVLALLVEAGTHICAGFFFDPIPSVFLAVCVAFIPVSTIISMRTISHDFANKKALKTAGFLNGIALAIATVYAILFAPLIPASLVGAMFLGLGLLGLSPLAAFIATLNIRLKLHRLMHAQNMRIFPFDLCVALLLVVLGVGSFSTNLTAICQSKVAESPANLPSSLLLMRAFGDRETNLRSCYGLSTLNLPFVACQVLDWTLFRTYNTFGNHSIPESLARELCYRVSGKSFNAFPHPKLTPSDHYAFSDEDYWFYDYDKDFAGEDVGGVVRDLKLSESNISGAIDPNALAEHLVWHMKFSKKFSYHYPELRAQITLPPGAVVSGCWLNVDGEKRDATFHARQAARSEYRALAQNNQSTLLVATAGSGRVLIQAPSVSQDLDLCLQIDSPLKVLKDDQVETALPFISERNFEQACKTSVSLAELEKTAEDISRLKNDYGKKQMKAYSNPELFAGLATNKFVRNSKNTISIAENPLDGSTRVLQSLRKERVASVKPLVIVLDGSDSLNTCNKSICDKLQGIKFADASIVWASDKPVLLGNHLNSETAAWKNAIERIRDSACVGGQDNAAAIQLALQNIGEPGANIVWIHGPQSIKLGTLDLAQIWPVHRKEPVILYEYQATMGPNELSKSLDSKDWMKPVSHCDGLEGDLNALFAELSGQSDVYTIDRSFIDKKAGDLVDAPSFIAQLCAYDQISRHDNVSRAGETAEEYRIVTPQCSAVVLLEPPPPPAVSYSQSSTTSKELIGAKPIANQNTTPNNVKDKGAGKSESAANVITDPTDAAKANNLIPTKPEPPLGVLMLFAFLIVLFTQRKQGSLKAKCH